MQPNFRDEPYENPDWQVRGAFWADCSAGAITPMQITPKYQAAVEMGLCRLMLVGIPDISVFQQRARGQRTSTVQRVE